MSELAGERVADIVASYITNVLRNNVCFCVTGAGIMHLTDGLAKNQKLRTIFTHHEQSASMAVDAYSRITGKVGVSVYSTGPAATNAITGLAGCWQDSVASLFISGQVKTEESTHSRGLGEVRQFGVQELNILPIVQSITKYSIQVRDPRDIIAVLDEAVHQARSGRPGPVWVEIPMDVQAARVRLQDLRAPSFRLKLPDVDAKKNDQLDALIQMIISSRRPLFIAGQGIRISGQIATFQTLVEKTAIPFVTPYLGLDISPKAHMGNVGITGVKGDRVANWAMQSADLIIVLGSSMHVSVTGYDYQKFAPEAKKVVVDIDLSSHKKGNFIPELAIEGDLSFVLPELLLRSGSFPNFDKWRSRLKDLTLEFEVATQSVDPLAEMSIYRFISLINHELQEDDIIISDAGSAFYAVTQALKLSMDSQRYITSGAMATMGFSLPAAIGAAVAAPGRVLAFTGDGSLQQNLQELSLLGFHALNVKLFVLNNGGYLSIRASQGNYFQKRFFGTDAISGLPFPNLEKLAASFGVEYMQVRNLTDFRKLAAKLKMSGPILVDVICPPNELIVPSVGSVVNTDGTMSSAGIEDMNPKLEREVLDKILTSLIQD